MDINQILEQKIQGIEIPKHEDPEWWRLVAYLTAAGATPEQISIMIGKEAGEIKAALQIERVDQMMLEVRRKQAGRDIVRRVKELAPKAIEVQEKLLNNELTKDNVRAAIADSILDRAMGKAPQTVEVGGSLLRQVLDRVDALEQERAIVGQAKRVDNEQGVEDVEVDPASKWVKENL